jgi:hypothetical protein
MNLIPDRDRVFPLSGGSAPRPALRPPRLAALVKIAPGVAMGHRAFLRAWAGRRARSAAAPTACRDAVSPG